MNYKIESDGLTGEMTFAKVTGIANNVFLSLMVVKGSFFIDPEFGLRQRDGLKVTEKAAALVREDIIDALSWLVDAGKAKGLTVGVMLDATDKNRFLVRIEVTEINNQQSTFTYFVSVV